MNSNGPSGGGKLKSASVVLPLDLGQWCEPSLLWEWTLQVVERLDWASPRVVEYLGRHPDYDPKMLLCLLTWSYATGVFESGEVEQVCLRERFIRPLCEKRPPSEREIARFRRDNRGLLRWSLARLFRQVLQSKLGLPEWYFPAGLRRYADGNALMRMDIARQMDRGASGF